jgi:hypothetical protein
MAEIWEGPTMIRLRASISNGYIDPICRGAACGFVRETERLFGADAYFRCDFDKEYGLQAGGTTLVCTFGWSYPECWGVWSDGNKATLELDIQDKQSTDIKLHLLCRGVERDGYKSPVVRIQANGFDLKCSDFDDALTDQFAWRSLTISSGISSGSRLEISFVIDGPLSPSLWGSPDGRQLGIAVSAFKLTRG